MYPPTIALLTRIARLQLSNIVIAIAIGLICAAVGSSSFLITALVIYGMLLVGDAFDTIGAPGRRVHRSRR